MPALSVRLAMRAVLVAGLTIGAASIAQVQPDAAREKRHADQIVASLIVGEAVWLQTPQTARFLGLLAQPQQPRAAVLLTHGPGLHPDHGITGELRMHLFDHGYTTLSLQMPVLAANEEAGEAYRELFPEAADRIGAGVRFLQDRGFSRVAIVSHAMGSGMTYAWLRRTPQAPLSAWAALSFYGDFDDLPPVAFPILDLYGENDYRGIRWPARGRKRALERVPGARQLAARDGGRFLAGGSATVLREVTAFLDGAPR